MGSKIFEFLLSFFNTLLVLFLPYYIVISILYNLLAYEIGLDDKTTYLILVFLINFITFFITSLSFSEYKIIEGLENPEKYKQKLLSEDGKTHNKKNRKKAVAIVFIVILLFVSLCFNYEFYNVNSDNKETITELKKDIKKLSKNPEDMEGVIDLSKTVYITSSGDKYHKKGCSYLKSKIKTTLYCAESVGLEPCSRCY